MGLLSFPRFRLWGHVWLLSTGNVSILNPSSGPPLGHWHEPTGNRAVRHYSVGRYREHRLLKSRLGDASAYIMHTCFPTHVLKAQEWTLYHWMPPSYDPNYIYSCLVYHSNMINAVSFPTRVPCQ